MRNLRQITVCFCILFSISAMAKIRPAEMRKMERKAESLYGFSEYDKALPLFIRLLDKDPENAFYNYRVGICYYYSSTSRPLSAPYFERALALSGATSTADLFLHAGLSFLSINRFTEAKTCFESFRAKADASYDPAVAIRMISYCENGEKAWKQPARIRVRNLGKNVNSAFPDYAPVLAKDESQLLFTSKRPGTTGGRKDDLGYYYEDIYQSKNLASRKWGASGRYDTSYTAPKIGPFRFFFARAENVSQLNTNDHDGSIAIAPDNKLFIYRYGDIWEAGWDGNRWSKPKRLHQDVDAKSSVEPSMCLSPDGSTMYFISDRKGGLGGKDIWTTKKQADGTWSAAENAGPNVNSPENEESPFVTKDGNTLYYSSEGHNSMGGYDVFRAVRSADGSWSSPVNLGAPINNGGDDVFYTPDESGNFAYYATLNRFGDGDLDLFSVMFYPEVQPVAKLRIPQGILPEKGRFSIVVKSSAGEVQNSFSLASGDSVIYPYTPGATSVVTLSAEGFETMVDTIRYSSSPTDYCLQEISPGPSQLQLNSFFFDIDYAVDADTLLDMMADRKEARSLYLGRLTGIEDVYTTWTKQTNKLALVKNSHNNEPPATGTTIADTLAMTTGMLSAETVISPVLFDYNESFLRGDMKAGLDQVCNVLKNDPMLKLQITGHADSKGSETYNLLLSEQRANAVRNYFIICGIPPGRLLMAGQGEALPVAPNMRDGLDDPEGRSRNRRVEIRFVR
jgi:outer membrane protein OmpA-like peptidoglycan-associated protein/tetratricopeptide (TPR) repeat protein